MPERTATTVEGRSLVLSNLDKVLWPATGTTKAEALHYYARIAPAMLPHLRERPASFVRFPDGVEAERFYTKNPPPGLPEWVATVRVNGKDGVRSHVVVNDLPSLMALANLAALEMHVPQWRDSRPDSHDRLVIDLDPGPGVGLVECCHVALLLREAMEEEGLSVWAKTSGAKGLHLYAPLTGLPEARVSGYAKSLARRFEDSHPDLVVHRMAKALRPGKVFVDWSQNATAKTTAAPYTLRARPVPAVSTPVSWEEIAECASPEDLAFTPEQVVERVAEHGDLLEGLLDPAAASDLSDAHA
ncbi:non-homologous end-joining DNA ligase [Wenjunlia tyrosinilytica]|uniref:ATP-dependent DNA ligase n=1 Tax=Wenjunlia tyrosinilytica TaxID=1544741 RepID=A0A917ZVA1_9ACTN|nr:non-homologous end-joining DNA ligase [Wenjunlia tyrosinilytica]GGO95922.1 ATP-dependent DNA ligase [Wenjunlia tyrosinilytica]